MHAMDFSWTSRWAGVLMSRMPSESWKRLKKLLRVGYFSRPLNLIFHPWKSMGKHMCTEPGKASIASARYEYGVTCCSSSGGYCEQWLPSSLIQVEPRVSPNPNPVGAGLGLIAGSVDGSCWHLCSHRPCEPIICLWLSPFWPLHSSRGSGRGEELSNESVAGG